MNLEAKSIADQIDCLARLTGAPSSFVEQVRELFTRKGISLDEDSTPYVAALEEAFIREESIRLGSSAVQRTLAQREAQDTEGGADMLGGRRTRRPRARGPQRPSVYLAASGPLFVTRRQMEDPPLVPGPEELQ